MHALAAVRNPDHGFVFAHDLYAAILMRSPKVTPLTW